MLLCRRPRSVTAQGRSSPATTTQKIVLAMRCIRVFAARHDSFCLQIKGEAERREAHHRSPRQRFVCPPLSGPKAPARRSVRLRHAACDAANGRRPRLSALHGGTRRGFQASAQLRAAYPFGPQRTAGKRAPRGPVVMPDEQGPKPPESGVRIRAQAPHPAPLQGSSREAPLPNHSAERDAVLYPIQGLMSIKLSLLRIRPRRPGDVLGDRRPCGHRPNAWRLFFDRYAARRSMNREASLGD
jgi:hypothetical protein